jgi:putative ABC transport system permease protein
VPEDTGLQAFLQAECAWIQFWVEMPDSNACDEYSAFVDNYVAE